MVHMQSHRRLVIVNQAVNYLTVGLANAFVAHGIPTTLITGSLHIQGETLDPAVEICLINRWVERPAWKKAWSYGNALIRIWWLLMTRYRGHEVLFVSVPPMGYLLDLFLPHRFSMIIWDVYPDVFEVTGMSRSHWLYRLWAWLNHHSFANAYRLFTISEPMADLLSRYIARERLIVLPLWSIFQENNRVAADENIFLRHHGGGDKFIVQYSGNIGLTHNVEVLLELAERLRDEDRFLVQIIGRGPRLTHIRSEVERRNLPNVQFLPFQDDEIFPHSLSAASVGVVILNERVSQGSVPSKTYNLMSFGIPALYIAAPDSELARYVSVYAHGACFMARDLDAMTEYVRQLADDPNLYRRLSRNAELAALDFRRQNADRFVENYLASGTAPS